ncbi:MAG TPA: histidine phosphatase family protein [Bacillales bacterium]|nr:histidine phosphatase family protein [Bacillales bacterium]
MQAVLIRHLPTAWNRAGRLQGRRDEPVEKGAVQAECGKIAEQKRTLATLGPFDKIIVSSLRRTRQTAEVYGYSDPVVEPLLDELDFGPFEGKRKSELIEAYGERWLHQPRSLVLGEPLIDFERRVIRVLRRHAGVDRLLLFGHGSWIRACLSIQQYGDVNKMNEIRLKNNELVHLPSITTGMKGGSVIEGPYNV